MSRWILYVGAKRGVYRPAGKFWSVAKAQEVADAKGGEWSPWERLELEEGYYRRSVDLMSFQKVVVE